MTDKAFIQINLFDGERNPLNSSWMARISDGRTLSQRETRTYTELKRSTELFEVRFFDNFFDNYTVLATPEGYEDAGWQPVPVSPRAPASVDLMVLPKRRQLNFHNATWKKIALDRPAIAACIRATCASDAEAEEKYSFVLETRPDALATFLNVMTALADIRLPAGKNPVEYYWNLSWPGGDCKESKWLDELDRRFLEDRFFAYVDKALLEKIREARRQGSFSKGQTSAHHGSTESYKQNQFDAGNVQFSFYGQDLQEFTDSAGRRVSCIKVEPDIDYYSDPAAHFFLEYIPHKVTGGKTDAAVACALRWMSAKREGIREFDPLFTIQPAP